MRAKLMSLLTVIGAVTVLVLAANSIALATTGKALLAGRSNTAGKMTTITRTTPGAALQVRTKSATSAPFAVNGKGRVANLNADTVDGKDSSVLGTRALLWSYAGSTSSTSSRTWTTSTMPAGAYLVNYEVFLSPGAGGLDCYLRRNSENVFAGESSAASNAYGSSVSAAGLITLAAPGRVSLTCNSTNAHTWSVAQSQPVRIAAVPISGLSLQGSPTASKPAARLK